MNKFTKMLAFASLASLAILSGCSESEDPDPTKAELCANGVNRECLLGTWNFNGVMSKEKQALVDGFDFRQAPGTLKFFVEKEKNSIGTVTKYDAFELTLSPNDINYANKDCNPILGTFDVLGSTVKLSASKGNLCIGKKTVSFDPVFSNDGIDVTMDVGRVWLTPNQVTATLGVKEESLGFYTEVYSISAKAK